MDGGTMPKDKTKLLQLQNKAGSKGSKSTTITSASIYSLGQPSMARPHQGTQDHQVM